MSTVNKTNRASYESLKSSAKSNAHNSSAHVVKKNMSNNSLALTDLKRNGAKSNGALAQQPVHLEEQFKAACDAIQNLPKNGPFQPSNEMLLKFYGYFKQSTSGPCKTARPSMFKVVERAKWDAWLVYFVILHILANKLLTFFA